MICLDSNVIAKLLFREEDTDKANDLIEACVLADEEMISCQLLPFEVTNAIRKRMRREGLALEQAQRLMAQFRSYPIDIRSVAGIHERALELATDFNLPATYDAHYVVLAQGNACDLWTADMRLLNGLRGQLSFVRSLADFSAPEFT